MNAMVDIGIVETHKENISPNPNGYRLRDLECALSPEERRAIVRESSPHSPDEDETDPLSTNLASIERQRMAGPAIGLHRNQLSAIEACLSQFTSWELYKNDLRYVKLWLDYSKFSEAPQRVFEYMESQRIGWFCAIFYESWVNLCETNGALDSVSSILNRGLQRKAQPLNRLRFAKESFNERHPGLQNEGRFTKPLDKRSSAPAPTRRTKRLQVFVDADHSDDGERDDIQEGTRKFPHISVERRENLIPISSLDGHALPQSQGKPNGLTASPMVGNLESLLVFRDANSDEDHSGDEHVLSSGSRQAAVTCSIPKLLLLKERRYVDSVRQYDEDLYRLQVEKALNRNNATGMIQSIDPALASVLYTRHSGITEQITDVFANQPPTESL